MHTGPAPFFSSEGAGEEGAQGPRILLLSYHFPPGQATGATRWQEFSRHAVERGWGLDVVTLDPCSLEHPDWDRARSLPDRVRLYGIPELDHPLTSLEEMLGSAVRKCRAAFSELKSGTRRSKRTTSDSGRNRDYASISRRDLASVWSSPRAMLRAFWSWLDYDTGKRWGERAIETAIHLHDARLHRVVVTCGPPHMVHDAGRRVARATGMPFVLDLRDPWSSMQQIPERFASPLWLALAARAEERCVRSAQLIVANTESLADWLRTRYPIATEKIITVLNGYSTPLVDAERPSNSFVIAYAGAIYIDRDPRPLMRAVARVVEQLGLEPEDLTLEFMGYVQRFKGIHLAKLAEAEGIDSFLRVHPAGTRRQAEEFLAGAALLVSLPQGEERAIPSKVYDYMRYRAWVVAQARRGSASERLLRPTDAIVVNPQDEDRLAQVIAARYREFCRTGRPEPLALRNPELSRERQATKLLSQLEKWRDSPPVHT